MSADPRRTGASRSDGLGSTAAGLRTLPTVTGDPERDAHRPAPRSRRLPVPLVPAATLRDLPEITAQSVLTNAPSDHPDQPDAGLIVHPRAPLAVFAATGGNAIALIRPVWAGSEAWLPVVEQRPGWVRVLLPTRPHGATGWIDASRVTTARLRHHIHLALTTGTLRLLHDDQPAGAWPITVNAEHHAIPQGRTFVLTSVRRGPATPPMLLRLAVHLNDRDVGLLTIHAEAAAAVNGGIGVPAGAMTALHLVAPGCLVHITSS